MSEAMPIVHTTGPRAFSPWTIRELIDAQVTAMLEAHFIAFENAVRLQIEAWGAHRATLTKKQRRHLDRLHNPPKGRVAGR